MEEITLLAYAGAALWIFIWATRPPRSAPAGQSAGQAAARFKRALAVVFLLWLFYGARCYSVWSGRTSILQGWFGAAFPAVVILLAWWLGRIGQE